MNRINFILSAQKVMSVNAIYKAKVTYVGGRQVGTIYKSREAKMTEAYIKEQVDSLNIPINYPWVTKDTLFRMTMRIVFKSGILSRDLDNTLFSFGGLILRIAGRRSIFNQHPWTLCLRINDYVQN